MNRFEDNLGLVRKIAHRYARNTRYDYDDLFQEGSIALWQASLDYKEGDIPFGAFAGQRITFHIMNYMRDTNLVKTSARVVTLAMFIKKRDLQHSSVSEIKKLVKDSEATIESALEHLKRDLLSLEYEYKRRDNKETLMQFFRISDNHHDNALHSMFLDTLKPKDRFIFEKWAEGYQQPEIAEMIGTSRGNVSNFMIRVRKANAELRKELKGG